MTSRTTRSRVDSTTLTVLTNTKRVWDDILYSSKWGALPGSTGMARLALSEEDKCVRDFFVQEATAIGADVSIDEMGNIFAVLPGARKDLPPIGMGSHLDTQPAGGRYDGILGVFGALEVLRTVKESGITTNAPLAAINWTNEEGARFSPGCSGSAVWAAQYPICKSYRLADPKSHLTFGDELKRIGYKGGVPANHMLNPLSAHFELHIEQRRLLQDSKKKIGVVTAIQGIRWYRVIIQGERAHAGSTPMDVRADALVVASKIVLFLEEKAKETSAVATVGVLNLDRPSSNTVPGYADFSIDLRHPSEAVLGRLESSLEKYLDELAIKNGKVEYSLERTWRSPAVDLDNNAVASTRYAATNVVGKSCFMDTVSLAGHDSALTATIVPTSMIFVPSKDGISHSPKEFTSEEECGVGVQVLLEAVLDYDAKLHASTRV